MPARLLAQEGHDITIAYMNSNIHPKAEYDHRLATLRTWAENDGVTVVEGVYDAGEWEARAGSIAAAAPSDREARCRACYRLRLEEATRYADEHGFDGISTTLTVSPYQYTEIIREELERAAGNCGLAAVFKDFRPLYDEATRLSRELGMYRQNYCGCRISQAEAEAERQERKATRAAAREADRAAHADEIAAAEALREQKKRERQAYAERQKRKRSILKQLRETPNGETRDNL